MHSIYRVSQRLWAHTGRQGGSLLKALLPFTKYHGVGNDFILIDARDLLSDPELWRLFVEYKQLIGGLAPILCDRHFGVGADGVILAIPLVNAAGADQSSKRAKRTADFAGRHDRETPDASRRQTSDTSKKEQPEGRKQFSEVANSLISDYPNAEGSDFAWIYTNSDGSPANMCGNGLRCLSLWAARKGGAGSGSFTIATAKGLVKADVKDDEHITVDIGEPELEPEKIPFVVPAGTSAVAYKLDVEKLSFEVTAVSMGNPHCVIFDDKGLLDSIKYNISSHSSFFNAELGNISRILQSHPTFPESANIEFVKVLSRDRVRCFVYERGCGFTLACASGAAAVVVAGVLTKRLDNKVTVELPGGPLEVEYHATDKHVRITGPATEVFSGVSRLEALDSYLGKSRPLAEASC